MSKVSEALAQQQRTQRAQHGDEGVDMCDAAMRVALDTIGIALFARDFGASDYEESPVLEVGAAQLW